MNVYSTQSKYEITYYKQKKKLSIFFSSVKRDRQLLILLLPCIAFYLIFRYGPMYGLIIAFKKFNIYSGTIGSPWVGFEYFKQFFNSTDYLVLLKNTLFLGIFTLLWTFPFPIIFAILLNELKNRHFKKITQSISFLPSFLSIVIVSSMIIDFLSPSRGMINTMLKSIGIKEIYFLVKPEWFRTIYISSEIWQYTGLKQER